MRCYQWNNGKIPMQTQYINALAVAWAVKGYRVIQTRWGYDQWSDPSRAAALSWYNRYDGIDGAYMCIGRFYGLDDVQNAIDYTLTKLNKDFKNGKA